MKGTWADSYLERTLRSFSHFARTHGKRFVEHESLEMAKQHLRGVESMKKQFKVRLRHLLPCLS